MNGRLGSEFSDQIATLDYVWIAEFFKLSPIILDVFFWKYRAGLKSEPVLLSKSQAGPIKKFTQPRDHFLAQLCTLSCIHFSIRGQIHAHLQTHRAGIMSQGANLASLALYLPLLPFPFNSNAPAVPFVKQHFCLLERWVNITIIICSTPTLIKL